MENVETVREANEEYMANFGARAFLDMFPSRNLAILTCMDARVEPKKALGLEVGEVNIIRNAGGRVTADALRSLIISTKLLGVDTIFVVHHTNCGMSLRTNDAVMRDVSEGVIGGADAASQICWDSIENEPDALIEDVHRLRRHPLIAPHIPIHGLLLDIENGELLEVPDAIDLGQGPNPPGQARAADAQETTDA